MFTQDGENVSVVENYGRRDSMMVQLVSALEETRRTKIRKIARGFYKDHVIRNIKKSVRRSGVEEGVEKRQDRWTDRQAVEGPPRTLSPRLLGPEPLLQLNISQHSTSVVSLDHKDSFYLERLLRQTQAIQRGSKHLVVW